MTCFSQECYHHRKEILGLQSRTLICSMIPKGDRWLFHLSLNDLKNTKKLGELRILNFFELLLKF